LLTWTGVPHVSAQVPHVSQLKNLKYFLKIKNSHSSPPTTHTAPGPPAAGLPRWPTSATGWPGAVQHPPRAAPRCLEPAVPRPPRTAPEPPPANRCCAGQAPSRTLPELPCTLTAPPRTCCLAPSPHHPEFAAPASHRHCIALRPRKAH
jgi:hypothetical protein